MLRRATTTLLNVLWRTTAVIVVGVALMVSVARLMLPRIDQYREPIAQWVSKQVDQPVQFDSIGASWRGWTPVIELTNVRLQSAEGERAVTRFAKAQFSIDPIKSFERREAVPNELIVSGLELSLARSEDGSIRLEGASQNASDSGLKNNALVYWLQTQRQLTIEEAAITWKDDRLLKPLVFSKVALQIVSDGARKQINGRARMPDNSSEFKFQLDATGDLLTEAWSGQMYLEGHGIDPSMLLEYKRWLGLQAEGGRLDFKLWSDWRNARFQKLNGEFSTTGSELGTAAQRIHIDRLHGEVAAVRTQPGEWHIRVSPLKITTGNGAWPDSQINTVVSSAGGENIQPRVSTNIDYLKIDDLVPMVSAIGSLPPSVRDLLTALRPHGSVRNLRLRFDPNASYSQRAALSFDFDDVGVAAHQHIPVLTGLAGSVAADGNGISIRCNSHNVSINDTNLYDRAINLSDCSGDVALLRDSENLTLATDGLKLGNSDIGITLQGSVKLAKAGAPLAQLYAHVDHADATRVKDYLPKIGVGEKTHVWFGHAFPKGVVDDGGIIVRGPLDKFPFNGTDGRFEVRLHVSDAELIFKPGWPVINDVDGNVVFSGRSMTVYVPAAKTVGANLTETTAFIPDLFTENKLLLIDGTANAPVSIGRQYLLQSPLKDHLEEVTTLLSEKGTMNLQLNLRIPLDPTPNDIKGIVTLKDAVLRTEKLGGDISSVQGKLSFTDHSFAAEDLKGMYAGQPVTLAFKGNASKSAMDADVNLTGSGDMAYLTDRLKALTPALADWLNRHHALEHLSGNTDWKVAAKLAHAEGAPTRIIDLQVDSSLSGMAIDYPSPIGKAAASAQPLSIHIDLATLQERGISFSLGRELHGAFLLSDSADGSTHLNRAALRFGEQEAKLPQNDTLSITGKTTELSINDWLDVLYDRMSLGGGSGNTSAPPIPVWMDVSTQNLQALGRVFSNVRVRGDSGRTQWTLHVDGDDIGGNIVIPHYLKQFPTKVELSKLHVPPRSNNTVTPINLNPARLPPVDIDVAEFSYQDINLGRGHLRTSSSPNGLKLDALNFESSTSTIKAQGEWTLIDDVHRSNFTIGVDATGLGALLGQFGYGVTAVEGGKTRMDIDASWAGSPADFTLERLHGSLTMNINDGRFLDVENPAVGRLFGLLSIQALPKRLTLDFNDLFSKGTGFDQISGNFELDGGNAYTNNLTMRGSSALIEITGRTGLAAQDYDQVATITPQISDSLPVASAIFGPAGAAAGAAIYIGKKILPSLPEQIDRMLSRQYSITGPWKEPKVQQVQGSAPEAPPAPSANG